MTQDEIETLLRKAVGHDAYLGMMGIELADCGPGRATVRMTVRPDQTNFIGTCHGGVVFAVADAAFSLSSNTPGASTVAIDAHIAFTAGAREGDVLTATSREVSRSNRLATYRIEVTTPDEAVIAAFTGTAYITRKELDPGVTRG
ncbi:MAG: hotdog fold thioesterase [Alphaproteobacteria bacterium]